LSDAYFHLRRPVAAIGPAVSGQPWSYADVGATATAPPAGWAVDEEQAVIGSGAATFHRAKEAIRGWRMFDLPWLHLLSRPEPAPGVEVAFASWQLGVWALNQCRIVYLIDEDTPEAARFGFAYGTLAAHAVAGEERFLATWDKRTDVVRFGIYKFSRLRHPLVRLVAPIARHLQRRFTTEAIAALAAAVRA
jgi:uncharacterized protein (UPF0548 family)